MEVNRYDTEIAKLQEEMNELTLKLGMLMVGKIAAERRQQAEMQVGNVIPLFDNEHNM